MCYLLSCFAGRYFFLWVIVFLVSLFQFEHKNGLNCFNWKNNDNKRIFPVKEQELRQYWSFRIRNEEEMIPVPSASDHILHSLANNKVIVRTGNRKQAWFQLMANNNTSLLSKRCRNYECVHLSGVKGLDTETGVWFLSPSSSSVFYCFGWGHIWILNRPVLFLNLQYENHSWVWWQSSYWTRNWAMTSLCQSGLIIVFAEMQPLSLEHIA